MTRKDKASRLEKLRKHWHRASEEERARFLAELRETLDPEEPAYAQVKQPRAHIANGRYLLPETIQRIEVVLRRRRIGPVELVAELGFPKEALAMTRGLAHGRSLRLSIIAALAHWLAENEATSLCLKPS